MIAKPNPEHGYEVVSLRPSWGGLSLLLFALSIPAPYLARVLPWTPPQFWMAPIMWVPLVFSCALFGVLFGFLGYRFSTRNGLAKLGLALNGLVLSILLLFAAVISIIFWGR